MRVFDTVDDLKSAIGEHLGFSEWRLITQDHINSFADATGDHQWIHVDESRAAQGPFGSTIAHGWMTLSLVAGLEDQIYEVRQLSMGVNYGAERVRFLEPVRVGSRVRVGAEIVDVTDRPDGVRTITRMTVDIEGHDKPACVADVVSLLIS